MNFFVDELNRTADWLLPLLWQATWQGGLALLLVAIACRVVKSIPARVQCWMWRLAFLKLLVAGLSLASWELPWLPPATVVKPSVDITAQAESESPSRVADPMPAKFPTENEKAISPVNPSPLDGEQFHESRPRTSAEVTLPSFSPASLTSRTWLLFAWCGTVAFALTRLLSEWRRVRGLIASAEAVECAIVLKQLSAHCRRLRVRRPPQLFQSSRACSPCLVGVLRPKIIVPAALLRTPKDALLDAVLLHELAHIRRRDLLWNWLPAVVELFFCFHPMMWWAKREWRVAQEIATDELALSSAKLNVASYAQSLVELVSTGPSASPAHLTVGVTETFSQLQRRIVAMKNFSVRSRYGIAMTVVILAIVMLAVMPWKLTAQETAANAATEQNESMNRMKEIVLAMHNYHDTHGHFPSAATFDKRRKPLLSWRVHLLPFLEQQALYEQFKLDQPWDSPHNKKLVEKMPKVFAAPGTEPESGLTRYLAVVGNETVFPGARTVGLREIRDGTTNTIAFIEAIRSEAVPWTEPDDLTFSDASLLKKIVAPKAKKFLAAFADGHVRGLSHETSLEALRALLGRADAHITTVSPEGEVTYSPRPPGNYGGVYGGYGGEMGGDGEYGGGYGVYGGEMGGYGEPVRERTEELELVLTTSGTVEILGKQVPIHKLGPILAAIKAAGDDRDSPGHVAIRLPSSTDYQHLRELTGLCEEYGFEAIRILSHTNKTQSSRR